MRRWTSPIDGLGVSWLLQGLSLVVNGLSHVVEVSCVMVLTEQTRGLLTVLSIDEFGVLVAYLGDLCCFDNAHVLLREEPNEALPLLFTHKDVIPL